MGRWTAPSDMDYYDDVEGRTHDGIERTCAECAEPVMVDRETATHIHVFHSHCLDRITKRLKRRTLKAEIEGRKSGAA